MFSPCLHLVSNMWYLTVASHDYNADMNQSDSDHSEEEVLAGESDAARDSFLRRLWRLGFRELPLQNQTTTFILINVFDVFMTYTLIRFGGIEANPVARIFLERWGFNGMIFFKMVIVAFVCVVAQIIGHRRLRTAKVLLNFGTLITGAVVVYGIVLYLKHLRN